MIKTLRIKRVFFNEIKSGIKKIEYRDFKPFYKRLFKEKINWLKIHYQGKEKLLVEVLKIRIIKPNKSLKEQALKHGIKLGPKIFKIYLGKTKELKNV